MDGSLMMLFPFRCFAFSSVHDSLFTFNLLLSSPEYFSLFFSLPQLTSPSPLSPSRASAVAEEISAGGQRAYGLPSALFSGAFAQVSLESHSSSSFRRQRQVEMRQPNSSVALWAHQKNILFSKEAPLEM